MSAALVAFVAVCLLAYVVPGPDWMVVLQRSARGMRAGLAAAAGVQSGLCVHLTAAALGVSALVLSSAVAFTVVKILGAVYLVYLGVRALWASRRPRASGERAAPRSDEGDVALRRVFGQAFLANVLNPKAALFFVAILPQFVRPEEPVVAQVVVLGAVDILVGVAWWALFVLLTSRLARLMRRPRPRRILDRVTGTVLVGLGVTVAAAH